MVGVPVWVNVGRSVRVAVLLGVADAVKVWLGSGVGDNVGVGGGGFPVTVNRPDNFQSVPTKIWTS
jgi:hypothetical protein